MRAKARRMTSQGITDQLVPKHIKKFRICERRASCCTAEIKNARDLVRFWSLSLSRTTKKSTLVVHIR